MTKRLRQILGWLEIRAGVYCDKAAIADAEKMRILIAELANGYPHTPGCCSDLGERKRFRVCAVCGKGPAGAGGCCGETEEKWFDVVAACDRPFCDGQHRCDLPRGHSGPCSSSCGNPFPPTRQIASCDCGRDHDIDAILKGSGFPDDA